MKVSLQIASCSSVSTKEIGPGVFVATDERPVKIRPFAPMNDSVHLDENEFTLRRMIALNHGCSGGLYMDDGELQCPHCHIDFRRTPASEIESRIMAINAAKLKQHFGLEGTLTGWGRGSGYDPDLKNRSRK